MLRVPIALLLVVLVALGARAGTARADGDPASDVLYAQWVFLPSDASVPPAQRAELKGIVQAAREAGFPVKVALVASAYDLGSVSVLWRRPRLYAKFLGTELSLVYHGRLLVAMPNGLGLHHGGRSIAADEAAIRRVPTGSGGAGLAAAAIESVRRLASAHGVALAAPKATAPTPVSHGSSTGWGPWIALAAGALAILLAWAVSLRLRPLSWRVRQSRGGKT